MRLDGTQLHLEPGQAVIPHGPDREFTVAEALPRGESQSIPSGFRNLGATTPLSDIFISYSRSDCATAGCTVTNRAFPKRNLVLTTKLRRSRRNGTWPAIMMFEFP